MQNMPIIGKFLAIMAVFGLFSIAVVAYSASKISSIDDGYYGLSTGKLYAAQRTTRANRGLQSVRAALGENLLADSEDEYNSTAKDALAARKTVLESFDAAIAAVPDDQTLVEQKTIGMGAIDVACRPVFDMLTTSFARVDRMAVKAAYKQTCGPALDTASANLGSKGVAFVEQSFSEIEILRGITRATIKTTFAIVLIGLVLVMVCGIFAVRAWIVTPTRLLAATMTRLANADFTAMVAGADRKDEIGGMARAVQFFKDNGLKAQALAAESETMRSDAEATRLRTAEADQVRAEAMAQATSGLGKGLKHLSAGDLTFQLSDPFAPDFETLRADFNAAVGQLAQTLQAVAEATGAIDTGSREVSASADDLSRRTEQQAASLEETAAALDQITVNVANSSKRADEARKVAVLANESAAQSGRVVADAVDAMQKIEASSNQISNIIGVIDEIAFQTNLLALNAGVEAARAGDAGKGFAVVAQEVRELAQRSAQAAKEIKDLIRNSSVEVQGGVKLVSDTGEALKTIEGYIVTVNQHMDSIATSAREQSVGLAEVNTAVNQMDQVTQQNAAMVEETSAAGATLASESGKLRDLIAQFQLGRSLRHAGAAMAAGPAHRPAASPSRRLAG